MLKKTRLAREAQKKAAAEAQAIIARDKEKKSAPDPEPAETEPKPAEADGLSTTQWISIIGIGATLLTTYVKRDDIKAFFGKKQATPPEPAPEVQEYLQPSRIQQPKKGIRPMD